MIIIKLLFNRKKHNFQINNHLSNYHKLLKNQNKFLIFNSKNNKILLFCSPDGMKCLSESSYWHSDGTFHAAAKYFYQLYIHSWYNNRMIACACILMHRRRTTDYVKVLKALKKEAIENGF